LVTKEQFEREVERAKARIAELRGQGLSNGETAAKLRSEGFWASVISKVLGVSGRFLGTGVRTYGDVDFVAKIERLKRDPSVPIIAREISDYAWWRAVCYDLGITCFYKLSPMAGLTIEDQRNPQLAYEAELVAVRSG
jgi:hypothetical protein